MNAITPTVGLAQLVALSAIGVAPENLRFDQPADDGIPQLAETLLVTQLYPILARPGRKGELDFMALDGRRRLLAYAHLLAERRIAPDHLVAVSLQESKAAQMAAAVTANIEREPAHLVDVIAAIGRLLKAKLKIPAIAEAIGYPEIQVTRWAKLAKLPSEALDLMRAGRLTQKMAQLLAQVEDKGRLEQFISDASCGFLNDYTVRNFLMRDVVTLDDPRFAIVSEDDYKAAEGRIETSLFDDVPPKVLDPDVLETLWAVRANAVVAALAANGVQAALGAYAHQQACPEGFDHISPYETWDDNDPAQVELNAKAADWLEQVKDRLRNGDETATLNDLGLAELAYVRVAYPDLTIGAAVISPDKVEGLRFTFFSTIVDEVEPGEGETGDTPSRGDYCAFTDGSPNIVEFEGAHRSTGRLQDIKLPEAILHTPGLTNSLNERYTDLATRALAREVAGNPAVAFCLAIAQLFAQLVLETDRDSRNFITTIQAKPYSNTNFGALDALDGEFRAELKAQREAYIASGLRPFGWVSSLSHGERMTLLAQLMALSINGYEFATHCGRRSARAEAMELAEATGLDFATLTTPDFDFFKGHKKDRLVGFLEAMGEDPAAATGLRKDDLAALVTHTAAEKAWAPAALSWKAEPETACADDEEAPPTGEAGDEEVVEPTSPDLAEDDEAEAPEGIVEIAA